MCVLTLLRIIDFRPLEATCEISNILQISCACLSNHPTSPPRVPWFRVSPVLPFTPVRSAELDSSYSSRNYIWLTVCIYRPLYSPRLEFQSPGARPLIARCNIPSDSGRKFRASWPLPRSVIGPSYSLCTEHDPCRVAESGEISSGEIIHGPV